MNLSDLVLYRNKLDALSAVPVRDAATREIDKITHLVNDWQGNEFHNLNNCQRNLTTAFDTLERELNQLKAEVKLAIEEAEKPWFHESYRMYEKEMCYDSDELILNRRPKLSEETEALFKSRLTNYANWQVPGMIIRPGLESFMQEMVSNDPLYLIDQRYELLQPAITQWPEAYQRRLRTYAITEDLENGILTRVPDNQFGICLTYNFFNYKPFEVIKQYLSEIYTKLRPGGVLIMTFNDCDRSSGVVLVEKKFCCYTPGYLVKELARSIGYETVYTWNDEGPSTWLELKKPGKLTSLRGGQTLAKIIPK